MTAVREKYTNIVGVDTHARTNTYAILVAATGQSWIPPRFPPARRASNGPSPGSTGAANRAGPWWPSRAPTPTAPGSPEPCAPRNWTCARCARRAGPLVRAAANQTTLTPWRLPARCSANRLRPCWNPAPRATGRPCGSCSTPGPPWNDQSTADRLILTSLLRTMDLGVDARHALTDEQILLVSRWRAHRDDDLSISGRPRRGQAAGRCHPSIPSPAASNHKQLQDVVGTMAAGLLDLPGVGPVSAAQMLVSYSHHGRVRSEAAFAALAGVNPIPASSGNTTRYRLNRHGDRQLNRAIHTIARSRMMFDPTTIAYVERRTAEHWRPHPRSGHQRRRLDRHLSPARRTHRPQRESQLAPNPICRIPTSGAHLPPGGIGPRRHLPAPPDHKWEKVPPACRTRLEVVILSAAKNLLVVPRRRPRKRTSHRFA